MEARRREMGKCIRAKKRDVNEEARFVEVSRETKAMREEMSTTNQQLGCSSRTEQVTCSKPRSWTSTSPLKGDANLCLRFEPCACGCK